MTNFTDRKKFVEINYYVTKSDTEVRTENIKVDTLILR